MRKNITLPELHNIMILILLLLSFSACDKKDDEPEPESFFVFNGNSFTIESGELAYLGIASEFPLSYKFNLRFKDDGLVFNSQTNTYSGTGAGLFFELYSTNENDLDEGIYSYDPFETKAPGTFYMGYVFDGFNPDEGSINLEIIYGGTVTLSKTSNTYTIEFDCFISGGDPVTGEYISTLTFFDESSF